MPEVLEHRCQEEGLIRQARELGHTGNEVRTDILLNHSGVIEMGHGADKQTTGVGSKEVYLGELPLCTRYYTFKYLQPQTVSFHHRNPKIRERVCEFGAAVNK